MSQYTNITGQGTTTVKPAAGVLRGINYNTPVATSVITIWDSLTASGAKIGTYTVPAGPQPSSLSFGPNGLNFNVGLTIQTATASSDITVIWE